MNSSTQTKVYEELITALGENPSDDEIENWIGNYVTNNGIVMKDSIERYQIDWESIAEEYTKIAERVFGTVLVKDVTAYLTINNRSPYSIEESFFFVAVPAYSMRRTVMHELWHFYTWQVFGKDEERIGKEKYNEIKEALTILLNVECKDLLEEGKEDKGYRQHQELRATILQFWNEKKDIRKLWNALVI